MFCWKKVCASALAISFVFASAQVSFAESSLLRKGMRNEEVLTLQRNLKSLGFFEQEPTGYFGGITFSAVSEFQKQNALAVDGIAGSRTLGRIDAIKANKPAAAKRVSSVSRGGDAERAVTYSEGKIVNLPWFETASKILARGDTAKVTDLDTGLRYMIKRTYGTNHADIEALTAKDTATLLKIAGGEWNWTRRAVIVEVDGYRIAASMTARPHAGRDDKPADQVVSNRSGGFGKGTNFDEIKGNDMDGHFDLYFLNSRTHYSNKEDAKHNKMIRKAYRSDK